MKKILAIIAGEPNSISSEIIFKTWLSRKKFKHNPFFIIGNVDLLNRQREKLNFNLKINEIKKNFNYKDLFGKKIPVLNVKYSQKKTFEPITNSSSKYIFNCFEIAIKMLKKNKLFGLINCPISKENLLNNRYNGITEYLSKKTSCFGNEVMMIYSSKFSVVPITTHIPIKKIHLNLNKYKICRKVNVINKFYRKSLNIKPKIGILGLNPHNYSDDKTSEEKKIIIPTIKHLKKNKVNVIGPISPDSSFFSQKKHKLNVIIGMFHDQILPPFKAVYGFNAINVTLGLPFIRVSPDHGTGNDIVGKRKADPTSLIESIKFFNKIN